MPHGHRVPQSEAAAEDQFPDGDSNLLPMKHDPPFSWYAALSPSLRTGRTVTGKTQGSHKCSKKKNEFFSELNFR